ncbi:acyl CoA binding protein-domain-containing protein [Crucibulum laeve]|uniref:Acyl CoA binding protein-domain-containing protein n=1 Tax=Crucibulum laeve TaxID=68775 RepID=A0A5C3LWS1_9AGAR|nr:acyl CoA binding protein-domain-containing protein [Crucibulum laeve]
MSEAKFNKAVEIIGNLPKDGPVKPSTDDQLYFYKYFKQANIGDNTTPKPGLMDFTGKAKWNAWDSVKGTSKEDAYAKYVEKLLEASLRNFILKKHPEESKEYIAQIEAA